MKAGEENQHQQLCVVLGIIRQSSFVKLYNVQGL
jgi:hypothetical protein